MHTHLHSLFSWPKFCESRLAYITPPERSGSEKRSVELDRESFLNGIRERLNGLRINVEDPREFDAAIDRVVRSVGPQVDALIKIVDENLFGGNIPDLLERQLGPILAAFGVPGAQGLQPLTAVEQQRLQDGLGTLAGGIGEWGRTFEQTLRNAIQGEPALHGLLDVDGSFATRIFSDRTGGSLRGPVPTRPHRGPGSPEETTETPNQIQHDPEFQRINKALREGSVMESERMIAMGTLMLRYGRNFTLRNNQLIADPPPTGERAEFQVMIIKVMGALTWIAGQAKRLRENMGEGRVERRDPLSMAVVALNDHQRNTFARFSIVERQEGTTPVRHTDLRVGPREGTELILSERIRTALAGIAGVSLPIPERSPGITIRDITEAKIGQIRAALDAIPRSVV